MNLQWHLLGAKCIWSRIRTIYPNVVSLYLQWAQTLAEHILYIPNRISSVTLQCARGLRLPCIMGIGARNYKGRRGCERSSARSCGVQSTTRMTDTMRRRWWDLMDKSPRQNGHRRMVPHCHLLFVCSNNEEMLVLFNHCRSRNEKPLCLK